MSTRKGRARQFLKYLVAILLVALSLPFPHTRALGNASSHDVVISSEQTRAGVTTEPEIWNVDEQQKLEGVGVKVASPGVLARGSEQVLKKRELTTVSLVLDAAVAKQENEPAKAEAASYFQNMGETLALEGDDANAADAFSRAFNANVALFGPESPPALESLNCLGLSLLRQGPERASEAASALSKVLQARIRKPLKNGEAFTEGIVRDLNDLVRALLMQTSKDSENDLQGAISAVDNINRLAWRYFVDQLPFEGKDILQQSLDSIQKQPNGPDFSPSRDVVISAYLFNLGFLNLAVLGEYDSAANVLSEAYALRAPVLGSVHPLTVQVVVSRGWALTLTGKTRMAASELNQAAEALLDDKQAAAAERLARQALHQGYAPLGVGTYAHTCFTQHINMLRKWGTEGTQKANVFTSKQQALSWKGPLHSQDASMVLATKILIAALLLQINNGEDDGSELLKLSESDRHVLFEEVSAMKS